MKDINLSRNPLIAKADLLAHKVYGITRSYPKEELYGITSQIRRSATSVPVNIIEGFARKGTKSYRQFLLISYGSLQELKYFIDFSLEEGLLKESDFNELYNLSEECAKMLWKTIDSLEKKN